MIRPLLLAALLVTAACSRSADDPAVWVASAERRTLPYQAAADGWRITAGSGTVTTTLVDPGPDPANPDAPPAGSALGGQALRLRVEAGAQGLELWVRARLPLPADLAELSWWAHSRGLPWAEARLVVEDPQGRLSLHRAPAIGDSPWTRYACPWAARGEAVRGPALPAEAAGGAWAFRGLLLRWQPFAHGNLTLGEVATAAAVTADPPPASWSLRDVDERLTHMAAYSGFRLTLEGGGDPALVPLGLLLRPSRGAARLAWQIADAGGAIEDGGLLAGADLADPAGRDLRLPSLAEGNHWLRVKAWDAAGRQLADWQAAYLVRRAGTAQAPRPARPDFDRLWSGLGAVRLEAAAPATVVVPVQAPRPGAELRWRLADGRGAELGAGALPATASTLIALPALPAGPQLCHLDCTLVEDGAVVDARRAGIAVAGQPAALANLPAASPTAAFQLRETDARSLRPDQDAGYEAFVRHAAGLGTQLFLCMNWDEVEPERGLVQFPLIDARIAAAARAGVPVIPTLFIHLDRTPRWLWFEQMLDQGLMNRQYSASFIRRTSPVAERTRAALADTARALARRYRDTPAVVGWNLSQGVESFWSDAARNGFVVDHSPAAARAFAAHLRAAGWDDARIAAAGGTLRADGGVAPPRPDFAPGFDRRPLWLAWEDFRQAAPAGYAEQLFAAIRSEDPVRPIYQYGAMGVGDLTCQLDAFRRHRATLCFGGAEATITPLFESLCAQGGVELDSESAAVPPHRPTLLLALFNKLSHGTVHGGFNIMWGRHFHPGAEHEAASRAAAEEAAAMAALAGSAPRHAGLAVGIGMRSLVNATRSMMWIDWMNLPQRSLGFAPMIAATVGGSAQVGYVTDHTPAEQLARWPALLFQEAPLLADEAAARLEAYVRAGGRLTLQGDTGRWDQDGRETWALRQRLGIAADGSEHALGLGRVRWLPAAIDWTKRSAVEAALAEAGWAPELRVTPAEVRHAQRAEGDIRYLVLFRKSWGDGGNPRADQLAGPAVEARVRLAGLDAARRWRVRSQRDGAELGEFSAADLAAGLALPLAPAELRILRVEPVE